MFLNKGKILHPIFIAVLFFAFSSDGFSEEKPEKVTKSAKQEKVRKKAKNGFTIGDNIMPKHVKGIKLPDQYLRGIYLNSSNGSKMAFIQNIIPKAKAAGVNCFVIDTSPYMSMKSKINPEVVKELLANGIYPISRIVSFQYGLNSKTVPQSHIDQIYNLVDLSVKAGFKEIQLDYIRYADGYYGLSLKQKYAFIANLLKNVKERINNPQIPLSTDIFGRIVYEKDDVIGQQLESMSEYAQVICPMVYPSHYYPDRYKLRNPYFTVRQSIIKGLNRVGRNNYIMPYLQAFKMNIGYTKLGMEKYMEVQVAAAEDTAGRGWIFWNAMNRYDQVFKVLRNFYAKNPKNLQSNNPSGYNSETGEVSAEVDARVKNFIE